MPQHPRFVRARTASLRGALSAGVLILAAALGPGVLRAGVYQPSSGAFALELRGSLAGLVHSTSGGEVDKEIGGQDGTRREERFRDIALEVGAGMSPAVYDWIATSWQGKVTLMSGAVLLCNSSYEVLSRREFTGNLSETTLPALDIASKMPAYLRLKLQPETSRFVTGSGASAKVGPGGSVPWTANSFRLEIPGLDCSHVRKIDAMTITTNPQRIDFPHVTITLPEADAASWRAWFESMVADGGIDKDKEKDGELVFLSPDMATELGRIHLFHLGMISMQTEKVATASDPANTIIARLSCERMAFDWKAKPLAH